VTSGGLRIDKFLWHTRLVKSRSLAARLCTDGYVELDGAPVTRASQPIRIGSIIGLSHGGWRRVIEVREFGTRRGPAAEAQLLYREISDPVRLTAADPDWGRLIEDEAE
jgi:ribosome-associated heat shock protein Hsp15